MRHTPRTRPPSHRPRTTRPTRAPATRSTAYTSIPATVWPPGPTTTDPAQPWPTHVTEQLLRAFSNPGDHVAVLPTAADGINHADRATAAEPEHEQSAADSRLDAVLRLARRLGRVAHLAPPTPAGARPVPYWDGLLTTTTPTVWPDAPATTPTSAIAAGATAPTSSRPDTSTHPGQSPQCGADLIVATVNPDGADDQLGATAARLLHPGGILAVLTHSHAHCGRLTDPTGSIVASCQQADLLYLQHIIALHTQPTIEQPPPTQPGQQHTPAHSDLLLFARPTSHTTAEEGDQ